ncbi:high-temperature-induced dauer-formation protein-domain-containing protein [Mycotypha africana]|uniref:high-temperature-induced dauer-formation protein-domain-containing protein n=1 Tax=Mycotypha africana TaxID=64632 RepID=UPI0023019F26|nr:high-temperature-induced dauer-formation protein-domain-containing protein [Mycotypha africana]KAI8968903.1 high-temperature-induced dauer-formation protein-domain-containing protein [Mycotypha africana]
MGATDSKLAFKKGVFRLYEERNVPVDADDYWTLFWTLPESVDDIFTLISASDIRKARDGARENLETLIDKILDQMTQILNSTMTQSINTANATSNNNQLLNCCRLLTRIIPFIFESPECTEWEDQFFWTPRMRDEKSDYIPATDTVDTNNRESQNNSKPQRNQIRVLSSRGEILIKLTLQALFFAGFTLPQSIGTAESNVNYVIWETGVGSSTPIGSSRENDVNRTEVLRLLIVLLSKSMYQTPPQVLVQQDRWLDFMVTKVEKKVVLAFLCSMMNTACKFNPMGWTAVPYNHIVYTDPREQLVAVCLRVLLVVLDYRSSNTKYELLDNNGDGSSSGVAAKSAKGTITDEHWSPDTQQGIAMWKQNKSQQSIELSENAYRYYLSKLHRAQDFQFLIDGIYRILSNPMQTLNSYLPGSSKRVRYHVEMMMLCWKLLELNNRFRNYLIETERVLDLMVVALYYASENKLDPSQIGLVRMCAFILQELSSNQTFSVKLNEAFIGHASLPTSIRIPNFEGTYADYLILSIFSLIASSRGVLSTLYPSFIKTITNISPYLKNICQLTCSKLISLFNSMSAPGFLLADESNHHLCEYLLETFNNIIHFQSANNVYFIYTILRNQQRFQKLADFTLENALLDIERARLNRLSLQQQPHHQGQLSSDDNLSEKQKGKLPECALSRVSSTASVTSQQQLQEQPSSPTKPQLRLMHRQSSVMSVNSITSNAPLPGAKNGFIPTEEWVRSWHASLPLETITAIIYQFAPRIEEEKLTREQIFDMISYAPMSEILPAAHPVIIRKFQWIEPLVIWFRSMLWGQTYVAFVSYYGPWNNTQVRLFHIKQQNQQQQQQAQMPHQPTNIHPATLPTTNDDSSNNTTVATMTSS